MNRLTLICGRLLILFAIGLLITALRMDTSVEYKSGDGNTERINNLGLMNEKQNYLITSGILLIFGIGLIFLARKGYDDQDKRLERQKNLTIPTSSNNGDFLNQLTQLQDLREKKVITEEIYEEQKRQILNKFPVQGVSSIKDQESNLVKEENTNLKGREKSKSTRQYIILGTISFLMVLAIIYAIKNGNENRNGYSNNSSYLKDADTMTVNNKNSSDTMSVNLSTSSDTMNTNGSSTATRTPEGNITVKDATILLKIQRKVKRDYPNDNTTQKMMFDQEVTSYLYMKNVTDLKIKKKVQRDYPLDFTTQKMIYNQEIDAKEKMK